MVVIITCCAGSRAQAPTGPLCQRGSLNLYTVQWGIFHRGLVRHDNTAWVPAFLKLSTPNNPWQHAQDHRVGNDTRKMCPNIWDVFSSDMTIVHNGKMISWVQSVVSKRSKNCRKGHEIMLWKGSFQRILALRKTFFLYTTKHAWWRLLHDTREIHFDSLCYQVSEWSTEQRGQNNEKWSQKWMHEKTSSIQWASFINSVYAQICTYKCLKHKSISFHLNSFLHWKQKQDFLRPVIHTNDFLITCKHILSQFNTWHIHTTFSKRKKPLTPL